MEEFQFEFHASDNRQGAAFDWHDIYRRNVDVLKKQISQKEYELKHVEEGHEVETLAILGNLRRELAEALWHINKAQDALHQIKLCVSENCHEFSQVSSYTAFHKTFDKRFRKFV